MTVGSCDSRKGTSQSATSVADSRGPACDLHIRLHKKANADNFTLRASIKPSLSYPYAKPPTLEGRTVGILVGSCVGNTVGMVVGAVGSRVGIRVGSVLGTYKKATGSGHCRCEVKKTDVELHPQAQTRRRIAAKRTRKLPSRDSTGRSPELLTLEGVRVGAPVGAGVGPATHANPQAHQTVFVVRVEHLTGPRY
jgi:hypothetical protein